MKKVFICSPFRGDVEANTEKALKYSRFVYSCGYLPITPHIYFTRFLNEAVHRERMDGILMGLELMKQCDEVWVMGCDITEGMALEIEKAKERKSKIRFYDEDMEVIRHETAAIDERLNKRFKSVIRNIGSFHR